MQLNEGNTFITEHDKGYIVNIQMPDGSRNSLHCKVQDLESTIITREMIMENSIDHMNIIIERVDKYFRLLVAVKDCNSETVVFHSRKLNLNDVVYERMQLLSAE